MTTVDELRTLFLFERLTDEQLEWLVERGDVRAYDTGAVVHTEGEPADRLYVLLDGALRMTRRSEGEDFVLGETGHRGAYTGAVRSYVAAADEAYTASVTVTQPSRFFSLPAEDFAELMRRWFPMAVHLLDGLFLGVRRSEATLRQREHLARLGGLSANLAHELNNPAAAAVRATGQLRQRVAGMRHKLGMIAEGRVEPEVIRRLVLLQEDAVERAAKQRRPLTPVEEADAEDALVDRLDGLGIAGAYDLAPVFVAAGLGPEWVDEVVAGAGGSVEGALRWLAYALETEALMDEIEDATGRISGLVGAVKQYSHLDSGGPQQLDVHAGLDATVTMLGHKLGRVTVRKEYDRSLPPVRAYGAELNQVWTNLIDNAADAMVDGGVLTLRTSRSGGELVVEVGDDGPGIPEAARERIYDAFFTTKPAGTGSGLGLDTARRIVVQRHRGTLGFTTGAAGTTFRVGLPLEAV